MLKGLFAKFSRDRRGNILMIYALSVPVLALAIGFAVDFGRAAQLRTKLNAAADAAALAALTPTMMAESNTAAQTAAAAFFTGQATGIAGLASGQTTVTVTITNPGGNLLDRQVTVCWNAAEATLFAGILGASILPMGNCSTAQAQIPPNIDFYLLLDNSPSMSLPATADGLTQMQNLTSNQYSGVGCAFACHQASGNNGDTTGNTCNTGYTQINLGSYNVYCATTSSAKCSDGSTPTSTTVSSKKYYYCQLGQQVDNYQMARNASITLRLDELSSAVTTLMSTAQTTSNSTPYTPPPAYRFAVSSFDSSWQIGFTNIMALTGSYVSGWTTASPNFQVLEYYGNGNGCASSACTSGSGVDDVATNLDNAMSSVNTLMPTPGNGTNATGDKPQEVLFIVTDGVEDELSGSTRIIQQINYGTSTNYCTTIKNRGIKIAILYTEYLPVPANSYYVGHVEPFQPQIGPALQACASPGLYYDAAIGADLSQALSSLFEAAVQAANLTQ